MSLRQILAFPFAAVITFGLFWTMQYLIEIGTQKKDEVIQSASIEFVRAKRDEQVNKKDMMKRPQKVDAPPPPPPMNPSKSKPSKADTGINMPNLNEGVELAGQGMSAGSDRDILPIVQVPPQYPRRALSRGIEGWVLVELTVAPDGSVLDPKVIDADPPSIFNSAAEKAVAKWKYKPKIENGEAVPRYGVQAIVTFQLAK